MKIGINVRNAISWFSQSLISGEWKNWGGKPEPPFGDEELGIG